MSKNNFYNQLPFLNLSELSTPTPFIPSTRNVIPTSENSSLPHNNDTPTNPSIGIRRVGRPRKGVTTPGM